MNRQETIKRAAEQWAKELTDESGRNRLLYYRELKTGTLNLAEADPAMRQRLLMGKKVKASKLFASEHFGDALRRIRSVNRQGTVNFEERGIKTLFLGWGMATWNPVSSSATPNAPVLLCPVDIERTGAAEVDFDIRLSGDWTLNEALLQHLANEFKVDASGESLMDPYGDGEQISQEEEKAIFAELSRQAERVPGFGISERVVLGNFMFKKMPMVNDIQNNLEALAHHDLIAAIAGDDEASQSLKSEHCAAVELSLPDRTPPESEFLVLDADSSQNAAINAALSGESLVLQGPPGTGKSQTIANLIASMMASGKSVLFVAEKRAAIDAVAKRLRKVGLNEFVMDLHGGISSRRKLARQFDRSLETIRTTQPVFDTGQRRLVESREELAGYTQALHQEREPWGLSYFEVLSRLGALELAMGETAERSIGGTAKPDASETADEARLQPARWFSSAALNELDAATTELVHRDLRDWIDLSEPIRSGRSPWAGARITTEEEAKRVLDACIALSGETAAQWRSQARLLLEDLGIEGTASLADWGKLVHSVAELSKEVANTESVLTLEVFNRDLERLVEDMKPASGFVLRRLFNKRYKAASAEVESLQPGANKLDPKAAQAAVVAAQQQARQWIELGCAGSPRVSVHASNASSAFAELSNSMVVLAQLLGNDLANHTLEELSQKAGNLLGDQRTLFSLPQLTKVERGLRELQLGLLLDRVTNGSQSAGSLETTFEYAWLRSIQKEVLLKDRRLATFQGTRQSRYVDEFISADIEHLRIAPSRVSRRVGEHAVEVLNRYQDQEQLIRREASKKSRHLPLRRLFERVPDALVALRPCWSMSPLDVAQTLPPKVLFDLVIFDEASQVMPCDAISALLRGKRAMVAGDSRQLPPTSFFDSSSGEEDLEDDVESMSDYESILDVMDARLRRRSLTWHYRSQDEHLITYSNLQIYDGSLTTFPGIDSESGLDYVLVPHRLGVATEKGSNSDEVLKVVDLMIEHARTRPTETLGVIAMGMHHANRIEEMLRRRIEQENSPDLEEFFEDSREERAFVKNLERVQGDERDAIILSIGYGKNAHGKMLYRFGPLNMQGGERRLNVAITRARKRMTLVSSFDYADLDPERTRSTGAAMLRGFLKFAQSGGTELDGADAQVPLNAFEIDVRDKLSAAGLDVVSQYGCSGYRIDFAVRHPTKPGHFALAVEADGASYHSSATVRDRDRLRQEHLERLGWRFCRIWSTDWFSDHRREVERVVAAFEEAVADIDSGRIVLGDRDAGSSSNIPADLDGGALANSTIPPPPKSPRPDIPIHDSIGDYPQEMLVEICQWVLSDGLLRTDTQLFGEVLEVLPFRRRGSRIDKAINSAIAAARGRALSY